MSATQPRPPSPAALAAHAGAEIALDAERAVAPATDGVQITWHATFEREGGDRPVCVAEWVARPYA